MNLITNKKITSKITISLMVLFFTFLLVAVCIPSMLPGALANNIWSVQAIKNIFHIQENGEPVSAPPPYHPHASIWISRQELAQAGTHRLDPVVDPVTPEDENEATLDRWVVGMNKYSDIQTLDIKARYLYQQGAYVEAFEIWKMIGQKAALAEAASEASTYGINSLALQAYQAAYEIDPEAYTLQFARALHSNGKSDQAIEVLNNAIQFYPLSRSKESWQVLLGDIYRAQSAWVKAEAIYQEVLAENPGAGQALIGMGWLAYQRDQDIATAVAQFERAMAVDLQSGAGQAAMGGLYSQRKQYDIAAEWYQVAYQQNRENQSYGLYYANALYNDGKTDQAMAEYQYLATRFPDYAAAYYHIAGVYQQSGQSEQAVTAIETALSLSKGLNLSFILRANAIYQSNQMTGKAQDLYRNTETAFQEVIDLFPDFPEPYLNIGQFYQEFNQTDRAIKAYQAALEIDPENGAAAEALQSLQEGG